MIKISLRQLAYRRFFLLASLMLLLLSEYGCVASTSPKTFSILPKTPLSNTGISSYPSMETIFKSDEEIVLLASWDNVKEGLSHKLVWEIINSQGDIIYSDTMNDFQLRDDMYTSHQINLSGKIGGKLTSGELTANLYIDDKLAATKKTTYSLKSIDDRSGRKVVIIPFHEVDDHPKEWDESAKRYFQNTFANAVYGEVQRIFQDTIPAYMVEQQIGHRLKSGCFENEECLSFIKSHFGDAIFIYGESEMQHFEIGVSIIRLVIFDAKSHELKRLSETTPYLGSYPLMIHELLKGVMNKKGFFSYLKEKGSNQL